MAILEQMGVPDRAIGYMFIGFTIAIYALIGIISRTTEISEYYVAGRRVPAFYNGMATGADWMSAASFISMAGSLYVLGYDGLGYVLGWTGGYVLVAILLAPYLRKFGIFTVPDFLGTRYEGNLPRLLGIIVLFCASFTYIVAQIVGVGIVTSRFLQIPFGVAVFVGLAGILVCSMLGGMRAVTWTQVAQYIILIIAYILPVAILSAQLYGVPIPQLTYGQALQRIGELEQELGVAKAHVAPFLNLDALNFFALILCLMIGTASLPHILMRYFTTPTVRDARKSVAWSLFFIFLLYFTAPAYAAFAKLEIYQNVIGQAIADLPVWVANWGTVGLVTICDAVDAGATIAKCVRNELPVNGNGDGILQLAEFVHSSRCHRAGDARDRGAALRDRGPGRGGRSGGGAQHGGRPPARDRQRPLARRLLPDDRPQGIDHAPPDRRPRAAGRGRRRRRLLGLVPAGGDRGHGRLGLLARRGGPVRAAGARHLVEADDQGRRLRRHDRRLRGLPRLPARHRSSAAWSCGSGCATSPPRCSACRSLHRHRSWSA